MNKRKLIIVALFGLVTIIVLLIIILFYCDSTTNKLFDVTKTIKAHVEYVGAKVYSAPHEAFLPEDRCLGRVGDVTFLLWDDYSEALVVPTGNRWKRIRLNVYSRVYKGITCRIKDEFLLIRKIKNKWYCLAFLAEGNISKMYITRNGVDVQTEKTVREEDAVETCFILLGEDGEKIAIDYKDCFISYNGLSGKWNADLSGVGGMEYYLSSQPLPNLPSV